MIHNLVMLPILLHWNTSSTSNKASIRILMYLISIECCQLGMAKTFCSIGPWNRPGCPSYESGCWIKYLEKNCCASCQIIWPLSASLYGGLAIADKRISVASMLQPKYYSHISFLKIRFRWRWNLKLTYNVQSNILCDALTPYMITTTL